jgi:hypothetical protein
MLLGGFVGKDGWVVSAPFLGLKSQLLAIGPSVDVKVYTWDDYTAAAKDALKYPNDKIVFIGYSGGGTRALWADDQFKPLLKIELMVLYDPSPKWQMINPSQSVKKCVLYHNNAPWFFFLGGGVCSGLFVERFEISQQHVLVQSNQDLHNKTISYVKGLL